MGDGGLDKGQIERGASSTEGGESRDWGKEGCSRWGTGNGTGDRQKFLGTCLGGNRFSTNTMANSQGEYSPAAAGSQYQSPFHQVPHGPSYGYSSPMFCVLGISKFFESFHG